MFKLTIFLPLLLTSVAAAATASDSDVEAVLQSRCAKLHSSCSDCVQDRCSYKGLLADNEDVCVFCYDLAYDLAKHMTFSSMCMPYNASRRYCNLEKISSLVNYGAACPLPRKTEEVPIPNKIIGEGFTIHVHPTEIVTQTGSGPYAKFYFGICKVSSEARYSDAPITVVTQSGGVAKKTGHFDIGNVSSIKLSLVNESNPQNGFFIDYGKSECCPFDSTLNETDTLHYNQIRLRFLAASPTTGLRYQYDYTQLKQVDDPTVFYNCTSSKKPVAVFETSRLLLPYVEWKLDTQLSNFSCHVSDTIWSCSFVAVRATDKVILDSGCYYNFTVEQTFHNSSSSSYRLAEDFANPHPCQFKVSADTSEVRLLYSYQGSSAEYQYPSDNGVSVIIIISIVASVVGIVLVVVVGILWRLKRRKRCCFRGNSSKNEFGESASPLLPSEENRKRKGNATVGGDVRRQPTNDPVVGYDKVEGENKQKAVHTDEKDTSNSAGSSALDIEGTAASDSEGKIGQEKIDVYLIHRKSDEVLVKRFIDTILRPRHLSCCWNVVPGIPELSLHSKRVNSSHFILPVFSGRAEEKGESHLFEEKVESALIEYISKGKSDRVIPLVLTGKETDCVLDIVKSHTCAFLEDQESVRSLVQRLEKETKEILEERNRNSTEQLPVSASDESKRSKELLEALRKILEQHTAQMNRLEGNLQAVKEMAEEGLHVLSNKASDLDEQIVSVRRQLSHSDDLQYPRDDH